MGAINLLSALLSHPPGRLHALLRLVPTEVLDTSRTFTLLAGVFLLLTAWGLRRGKRRAFVAALFLGAVSVPVNLLKSFDFEEATVAAALLFFLGLSGEAFTVKSRELSARALRSRVLWITVALALYAVLGSLWVRVGLTGDASLGKAAQEAAYRLLGLGGPTLPTGVPRLDHRHRMMTWFLDSLPLTGLTMLSLVAIFALGPVTHRGRHRAGRERTRELLGSYGVSTVSSFALEPEVDYFFTENRRAVIAYRFESDTLLGIGDPIGPEEELGPILRAFDTFCREHDWRFAFFQARAELLPLYRELGWRALHIGVDPVIHVDRFALEGSAMGDVRRALRRLSAAGLEGRMFLPDTGPFDVAADPDGLYDQMRALSAEWLRARAGGEKGFCMGRFGAAALRRSWLAVAWDPSSRRVEGFVTWVPVWARRGWALDLMRRRSDSRPGVMDFLIARSVEEARRRGDRMLSLSLSALSATDESGSGRGDGEAERTRAFLREHLARFYDFKNLFRWKSKFRPEFEDRYLVYPGPLALPRVALSLVRAQSPGGLRAYFRRGTPRLPAIARPREGRAGPPGLARSPGARRPPGSSDGVAPSRRPNERRKRFQSRSRCRP
jgi:phosphatidylglycerol lysyltransferase